MLSKCGHCGGKVRLIAKTGRVARYKDRAVPLPSDLELPTCVQCGEEYLNDDYARKFDDALERSFRDTLTPADKGYRYKYDSIADVCQDISMSYSGAGEPLPDDLRHNFIEWLQWRVEHWTKGIVMLTKVDAAYRQLVLATLELEVHQLAVACKDARKDPTDDHDIEG